MKPEAPDTAPNGIPGERALSPVTAGALALVGIFSFCAFLVLGTYASLFENGEDGGGHALSKSAVGFAGLVEGLKTLGEPVLVSRHPLPATRRSGLYILTPTVQTRLHDVTAMDFAGPVLVVMPKWLAARDPNHHGWVSAGIPAPPAGFGKTSLLGFAAPARRTGVARPMLSGQGWPFNTGQRLALGPIDAFQTLDISHAPDWEPVLTDESGRVVLAEEKARPLYLLSDPDILDNQGLANPDGFAAAVTLVNSLRTDNGPLIFDVTLNGLGLQGGALRLLFDPPFLAVTLCLAMAAGLAGFQAFCRFGPALTRGRAVALGKQALADNAAALMKLAGREPAMAEPYADLSRDLAAKAVGAPRNLGGEALMAYLDRLAGRRGMDATLAELNLDARLVGDRGRLVAVARRLYRWRREMTGEA